MITSDHINNNLKSVFKYFCEDWGWDGSAVSPNSLIRIFTPEILETQKHWNHQVVINIPHTVHETVHIQHVW